MAKTPLKSEKPLPSSSRPAAAPSGNLLLGYRILKIAALLVGLPGSLLCLMAIIGAFTENGYVRVIGALVIVVAAPLVIADRLLPAHDPTRARGLVGDVCAVSWMLVTFVLAGAANASTRPLLAREGDRLVRGGHTGVARAAYLLAGVSAQIPQPPALVAASASASGSAPPPAPAADAGAASSAAVDAGAAIDAGSKPKTDKLEKTPAEIFKDLSPSVVTVFVKAKAGEGGGTGFLVDKDGIIATNHHVIANAAAVRVKFQNGSVFENVELLVDDAAADLALLQIDVTTPLDGGARPDAAPLVLGDSETIVVGERAVSIGNPLGLEHTLTDGLISSRRLYEGRAWIQFSAPISPGNSGGPLFNMRGEVVGVTTATITGRGMAVAQNINLAVPANEVKKLFKPAYPGRRKFGDGSAPSQW